MFDRCLCIPASCIPPTTEVFNEKGGESKVIYSKKSLMADALTTLTAAFHSVLQSLAAAKCAIKEFFGLLTKADDTRQCISVNPEAGMEPNVHAPRPVMAEPEHREKPTLKAMSRLREEIKAQRKAAEAAPRKKQTVAKIVTKGIGELSYLKAFIAKHIDLEKLPRDAQCHLLAVYEFLGVTDAGVCAQVDEALMGFIEFAEALGTEVGVSEPEWPENERSSEDELFFLERAYLSKAMTFATIWLDARAAAQKSSPNGSVRDMHYAYFAALDFLSMRILRNFPGVSPEDFQAAELLSTLVNKIPDGPRHTYLSLKLPVSLTKRIEEELPDDLICR
jgi:hypothetical protein